MQIDINGNISLQGKPGVMIFIDDKPTYMSSADLVNYLKSLPASTLGLIEIMTNPPAKYDAAGNAGIINIKLKRIKTKGTNGSFNTSYGQGVYSRSNNSLNLSYRVNKIYLFTNLSYNANNSYQDLTIKRAYFNNNGSLNSQFNQNSYIKREATGANVKVGMDYYANKNATIGVVLSGFENITFNNTTNKAEVYNGAGALANRVDALSPSKRKLKSKSANINYNYKYKKPGKEWLFNGDYIGYTSGVNQNLLNTVFATNGNLIDKTNLISNLAAKLDIVSANVDFTNPLKKGGRLEAGFKTSYVTTKNFAKFFDEVNNVVNVNNVFSNSFNYNENINAAYINVNRDYKRFSFQTGLRVENTNITAVQLAIATTKDSAFTRNYTNFFPTVYFSYSLDTVGNHQLGLNYGKRVNRPDYQSLNPFTYPLDRFTFYAGNPFLKPTFSIASSRD